MVKKMNKIFIKLFVFVLIIVLLIAFSASYRALSIDNLAFVVALGIDKIGRASCRERV